MEEIYKEYSKKVYSYLFSLSNDENIAEELLQETFYSAIKNINKFRRESSVKTWLYAIAKNKWIDYYNKFKKIEEVQLNEDDKILLSNDTIEEDYLNKYELLNICRKIHNLDEKSKEIFYLRIGMNYSFKEIANITENTEENVRVIFYRIKLKLKEDLKDE